MRTLLLASQVPKADSRPLSLWRFWLGFLTGRNQHCLVRQHVHVGLPLTAIGRFVRHNPSVRNRLRDVKRGGNQIQPLPVAG